jgi:hypothetical protein
MFRATLIAFAAAVMLATAFVPTEASARHGRGYSRGWVQPPAHCRGYFMSGTNIQDGYWPYAGCDPLEE